MTIRRLDLEKDADAYREAYYWDKDYPRWFRETDSVFKPDFETFMEQAEKDDQADIGVFNPELVGLVSMTQRGKGIYEAHLRAKRGTDVDVLAQAAFQVRHSLREIGMKEVFVWVNKKNKAVQKLCMMAGMRLQGLTMIKPSGEKLTYWLRMVTN